MLKICIPSILYSNPPTHTRMNSQKSGIFGRDLLCIFGASTLYTLEKTIHWFALRKKYYLVEIKNLCTLSQLINTQL